MLFVNVIKPTHRCNLACKYCYNEDVRKPIMTLDILEKTILETFSYTKKVKEFTSIDFIWHGGEPMLAGLDFYKKVIELQNKYSGDMHYTNILQTNGTLINNKWADFLLNNKFLVSISIDGPKLYHDKNRIDKKGNGSFDRVIASIKKLHNIGLICGSALVISKANKDYVEEIYDFMVENHIPFNIIPLNKSGNAINEYNELGLMPDEYAEPWIKLYNLWFDAKKDKYIYIADFINKTKSILLGRAADCEGLSQCGNANCSTDPLGDIYPCASLSGISSLIYGNLNQQSLDKIMHSPVARKFRTRQPTYSCTHCKWQYICHGGCQARSYKFFNNDQEHKDYYCPSLYKMYEHVEKKLATKGIVAGSPFPEHMKDGLGNTIAYLNSDLAIPINNT